MTTASTAKPVPFRSNRQLQILSVLFVAVFIAAAIDPVMPEDFWAENGLVIVCVGGLAASYRRFVFSELSYLLIFLFLCLHEWGAHHRYATVPVGEWGKMVFGTIRNDYDRVVHFAFGLLIAYPQYECVTRAGELKRSWSLWLSPALILGYGAGYEFIEAAAATLLTPDAGEAFLGLQGDPWDTHKDMFMAFAGAVVTMLITVALSRKTDPAAPIR
jgi:putative membrane protein